MSHSHHSRTILLVDDDLDILLFLKALLEEEGYLVQAENSPPNIKHLQPDALPDLIILDMLMSGTDGRELTQQLKRDKLTALIPVLMISAHPGAQSAAYAAGADAFVAKPFEMNVFLSKVARALEKKE
jgi:CheY-like chemotaxis protein